VAKENIVRGRPQTSPTLADRRRHTVKTVTQNDLNELDIVALAYSQTKVFEDYFFEPFTHKFAIEDITN
jgi:hypothetical protein